MFQKASEHWTKIVRVCGILLERVCQMLVNSCKELDLGLSKFLFTVHTNSLMSRVAQLLYPSLVWLMILFIAFYSLQLVFNIVLMHFKALLIRNIMT